MFFELCKIDCFPGGREYPANFSSSVHEFESRWGYETYSRKIPLANTSANVMPLAAGPSAQLRTALRE